MILIDLPMPEACDVCPFNYDFCWCNAFGNYGEWEKYSDDWNTHVCDRNTRPEYFPLKEIVRCKDCKYWYFADNRIPCEQENVCGRNGIVVTPDWFCADGKKR